MSIIDLHARADDRQSFRSRHNHISWNRKNSFFDSFDQNFFDIFL